MIDAHRGAFEYDWRARFGLPLTVVGRAMTWGEASRLTRELAKDPDSRVAAALSGWQHPASREALIAWDHYDAFMRANFKKPLPYPRPWDPPPVKFGTASLRTDQMRAVLDAHRANASTETKGDVHG